MTILATGMLAAMSVWFSASAVVPALASRWELSSVGSAGLTVAVQLGFACGAVFVAATGLADAVPARRLFGIGAAAAAAVNLLLLVVPAIEAALAVRFATGAFLAAVYPSAMKEASTWFRKGRGLALGVMIAALTLGSALPHLVNALGGLDWRVVIVVTTVLTAGGGALVITAGRDGPYGYPRAPFRARDAIRAVRSRPVLLANVGYLGHMWELYALWAWIVVLAGKLPAFGDSALLASVVAFGVVGVGAAGCLAGGVLSDRWGRSHTAALCMVFSALGALGVALAFDGPLWIVLLLLLWWGFWVIADSAQFSAMVTEQAEPAYVGTAVTVQMAAGFTLTALTIVGVPWIAGLSSWAFALACLTIGPAIGVAAMLRFGRVTA